MAVMATPAQSQSTAVAAVLPPPVSLCRLASVCLGVNPFTGLPDGVQTTAMAVRVMTLQSTRKKWQLHPAVDGQVADGQAGEQQCLRAGQASGQQFLPFWLATSVFSASCAVDRLPCLPGSLQLNVMCCSPPLDSPPVWPTLPSPDSDAMSPVRAEGAE